MTQLTCLKLYRVRSDHEYYWVAAKSGSDAIRYAKNKRIRVGVTWRALHAGPKYDRCVKIPGVLDQTAVNRVFGIYHG